MECKIQGCNGKVIKKGWCYSHYKRWYKYGDPLLGGRYHEKHNMCDMPEYTSWCKMKSRCSNKNNTHYEYYGGRGISVCQEWVDSFVSFYNYIGPKPNKSYTIDRIDTNGNYEHGNVKWSTKSEQSYNRGLNSNNRLGQKNIIFDKERNKYRVEVGYKYKKFYVGRFNTLDEALQARNNFRNSDVFIKYIETCK